MKCVIVVCGLLLAACSKAPQATDAAQADTWPQTYQLLLKSGHSPAEARALIAEAKTHEPTAEQNKQFEQDQKAEQNALADAGCRYWDKC